MDKREGFTDGEKAVMCLSTETLEGLHMSGSNNNGNQVLSSLFFLFLY